MIPTRKTETKIRKIRMKKNIGTVIYSLLAIVMIIDIAIVIAKMDTFLMMQEDLLNQVMEVRQELPAQNQISTEEPVSILTDAERSLIEQVVAAEARGDTFSGMVAVAQTIKDRGDLWDMSYTEVVQQPYQYAAPYEGPISEDVSNAVAMVFDIGGRATEEPITHFHSCDVDPYWTVGKINRGSCGSNGHTFYY